MLDFVAGVTPIGATTYLNETQDQEKAMFGPRIVRGFPAQMFGGDAWTANFTNSIISSGDINCAAAGAVMHIPFQLREGEKVVSATVIVSSTQNGGSLELAYGTIGSAASTQDITGATANPWNTTIDNFANAATYTYNATTYIIGTDADYVTLYLVGPGGTGVASLWDAYLTVQFGN